MTSRKLKGAVALAAGTILATAGGSALAQSSDDMRKQIEDLQRQLQTLKERLDRQEAAPRPSAPAQPSSQPQTAAPAGYSGGGLQVPADIPGAWQGWYAGGTIGIADLRSTWNDYSSLLYGGDASSHSGAKFVGSLRGGYNWVQDRLLLGLELDVNSKVRQTEKNLGLPPLGGGASTRATSEINWYSSLRARAGVFASPDALIFITGGPAYGKQTSTYTLTIPGASVETDPKSSKNWGYSVGAGLEYRLSRSLSMTAEYSYLSLLHFNTKFENAGFLPPGLNIPFKMTNSLQTGRIGLNYRF